MTVSPVELGWGLLVLAGWLVTGWFTWSARQDCQAADTPGLAALAQAHARHAYLRLGVQVLQTLWVAAHWTWPPDPVTTPQDWQGWVSVAALTGMLLIPLAVGGNEWHLRHRAPAFRAPTTD